MLTLMLMAPTVTLQTRREALDSIHLQRAGSGRFTLHKKEKTQVQDIITQTCQNDYFP